MQAFDPRQNMSDSKFEIFHYRDAKFEGVPVHQHDFYEVYFFIGGSVEYSVEGRTYELKSGDLLLINPLELHQPRIAPDQQDYERIVLWINKNYLSELCFNKTSLTRCFDSSIPDHTNLLRPTKIQQTYISAMLTELINESKNDSYAVEIASEAILLRFLVELNRLTINSESAEKNEEGSSSIIPDVLEYINKHFCEKLTLNSIANEFFVSKYYLCRAFKKHNGISIHGYITRKRVMYAKQLIDSGVTASVAAYRVGFGDYSSFYRAYVKIVGKAPTAP